MGEEEGGGGGRGKEGMEEDVGEVEVNGGIRSLKAGWRR